MPKDTHAFSHLTDIPRPADKICECCGQMKYAYWNPSLGWYWVHN